ncbi:hypothetical protein Hanom_Chr13g01240561 [Helianthus anomalus]
MSDTIYFRSINKHWPLPSQVQDTRCDDSDSILKMPLDFLGNMRLWCYGITEAVIVFKDDTPYFHIFDSMWIVNMSKKDIARLFHSEIYHDDEDTQQAMTFQLGMSSVPTGTKPVPEPKVPVPKILKSGYRYWYRIYQVRYGSVPVFEGKNW